MPYREVKLTLYVDGIGPMNAILLETERGDKRTRTIYADDENPGEDLLNIEFLPDGWVDKVFAEIDQRKQRFSFVWIDQRFSHEENGILNAPASGTFYYGVVKEIEQGLTEAERAAVLSGSEFKALCPGEAADAAFKALYPDQAARVEEARRGQTAKGNHRLMGFFTTEHLPEDLRPIGNVFVAVAEAIDGLVPEGPERTVALRKLLESKDAAIRAVKYPGN